MKNFVVTFACVPGTGKSALTHFLSIELGLPIFSNDAIRDEVHQDQDMNPELDVEEFEKRRAERIQKLLSSKKNFIYDASVDRRWQEFSKQAKEAGYDIFVISFDLSKDFTQKLYSASTNPKNHLEGYMGDHQNFLDHFKDVINLSIDDASYPIRRQRSLEAIKAFIG